MGHIAKADGKVSDIEIKMASSLMDQMGLEGDTRKEAQQAFRDGKEADFALKDIILELKESCHGRRDILQVFLEILIQAAYVDGRLDKAEQKVLETAALHLGFQRSGQSSHRAHQGSQSTYSTQQSLNDAYQILGVSESDDDKAVKKAYRKLMSENHPDKLVSKGLPKQALEIAKNKAQDIQAAYEMIKEKRGMR